MERIEDFLLEVTTFIEYKNRELVKVIKKNNGIERGNLQAFGERYALFMHPYSYCFLLDSLLPAQWNGWKRTNKVLKVISDDEIFQKGAFFWSHIHRYVGYRNPSNHYITQSAQEILPIYRQILLLRKQSQKNETALLLISIAFLKMQENISSNFILTGNVLSPKKWIEWGNNQYFQEYFSCIKKNTSFLAEAIKEDKIDLSKQQVNVVLKEIKGLIFLLFEPLIEN